MPKTLRIASWNIAGARKIRSLDDFDYADEDINYFVDQLGQLSPDIVCLQESHTNQERVIAAEIAEGLGLPYTYNAEVSPSHIDTRYHLGNAILSRFELTHDTDVTYPYPAFADFFPDGRPSQHHDKMMQIFTLGGLTIANTQLLPLRIFDKQYDKDEGAQLAEKIDDMLCAALRPPLIVAGDFNYYYDLSRIYTHLYAAAGLQEALPDKTTHPNAMGEKQTTDHILVSAGMSVLNADIIATQTDHYLCFAEVNIQ